MAKTLLKIGNFNLSLHHLLIIGVLSIAFSITFMVRSQAADFGYELNEFDPYFNYRATEFLVNNGLAEYLDWHDYKSWYPQGRNVSTSSQIMLHITAAVTYQLFGNDSTLYDFIIIFPVIFGSLTVIVIFALVRVLGGTTAGLFAAMLFSVSIPVILRGTLGWFKSEPLGLFYGLLGIYLFVSGIKSKDPRISILKLVSSGIILAFSLASWGGNQFFIIPLGIFFLMLPFLRKDYRFQIWAIPVFTASLMLTTLLFERPGPGFVTGLGGFAVIGPTIFLVVCNAVQIISSEEKRLRNSLLLLGTTMISGLALIAASFSYNVLGIPSFRYLNAVNPFLTTTDPLVDSVSEHATTTLAHSFFFHSVLMIFAGIGIWILLRNYNKNSVKKDNNDMIVFALILALVGVYISSAFIRLELFASVGIIILASLGLSILFSQMFSANNFHQYAKKSTLIIKPAFAIGVFSLLLAPIMIPSDINWVDSVKVPPTILNGGSFFAVTTTDWLDTLSWLKTNTPTDSVIAAWWDYGYWITTVSERATLADNATSNSTRIQNIAKMFLSTPDESWHMLQEMQADYVLIFVVAQQIQSNSPVPLYRLGEGGDETKKQWFMRIAEEPLSKYLLPDGYNGNEYFWTNTTLGQMFPYSVALYFNQQTQEESSSYQPNAIPLYIQQVKYPADGDGPFRLAYTSPSYLNESTLSLGVIVYEVNKNYTSSSMGTTTNDSMNTKDDSMNTDDSMDTGNDSMDTGDDSMDTGDDSMDDTTTTSKNDSAVLSDDSAVISTQHGDITIQFYDEVAPNHVENFKSLAQSDFYDQTLFHRIVPGFVIQGGDPNTKTDNRNIWGQGGPDHTLEPEFSDLPHKKYEVSMARSQAIDSAGSQFFIILDDAPFLDGQYTVFGKVTSGFDTVDKIGALSTNPGDQPVNPDDARIETISVIDP